MRRVDDDLIDPEIAAELDAIDATLAGEPVDPRHAEIAELALLLAADRPRPDTEFAHSLDQRVSRRFAAATGQHPAVKGARRSWLAPFAGLATAGVAALLVVVTLSSLSSNSSSQPPGVSTSANASALRPGAAHRLSSAHSVPAAKVPTATTSAGASGSTSASGSIGASGSAGASGPVILGSTSASTASGSATSLAPAPIPNGRKVIQSAELALSAPSKQIATVADEVFQVVGRENGVVNNSQVTSGAGGYAVFQLSVPSSALQATMTSLSQLPHSSVSSRTDATQDVNGQYLFDQRQLTDARALRTSLLKQLANATTTQQIDSLQAQIHDAEASINSDQATLRGLQSKVNNSQITVTINQALLTPVTSSHGHSFGLGTAVHDAGRVLTVAAGVGLIALAALLPVALVAALIAWIAWSVRRRRREQALDLA